MLRLRHNLMARNRLPREMAAGPDDLANASSPLSNVAMRACPAGLVE